MRATATQRGRRASCVAEADVETARRFAVATRAVPFRARARSEERAGGGGGGGGSGGGCEPRGRDNVCFEMSTSPPRNAGRSPARRGLPCERPIDYRYDSPPRRAVRPLVITYNWHENACFDGPVSPNEQERETYMDDAAGKERAIDVPETPVFRYAPLDGKAVTPSKAAAPARREPPVGASAYGSSSCDRSERPQTVTSPGARRRLLTPPSSPPLPARSPPPPPLPAPPQRLSSPPQQTATGGRVRRYHYYTEIDSIACDTGSTSPTRPPALLAADAVAERTPPLPPRRPRDLPPSAAFSASSNGGASGSGSSSGPSGGGRAGGYDQVHAAAAPAQTDGSHHNPRSPSRHPRPGSSYASSPLERQPLMPHMVQSFATSVNQQLVAPMPQPSLAGFARTPRKEDQHIAHRQPNFHVNGQRTPDFRTPERRFPERRTPERSPPDRRAVTYIIPQQGGAGQACGATAVVAPRTVGSVMARPKALECRFADDAPVLKTKTKGGWHEDVEDNSKPPSTSGTLSVLGVILSAAGTATVLIGMYLLAKEGRRYYLDFGLLAGVVALALALLAFRVRRWDTPPNRNFLSGMTVSCTLALLETALMSVTAALRPTPGDAFADLLGGGVCGVAVLASALAAAAAFASCCGAHPPADNRVASSDTSSLATLTPPGAAVALHHQGFAL